MCGICGWIDWRGEAAPGPVRAMAAALGHRGPDDGGLWHASEGIAVLGHRRLAVLDTSENAAQPMKGPDGSVLVFNGEVYNFREIRSELEGEGRAFCSSGDTEVVLAAFARWGPDAADRFDGQFALAWWNPRDRSLLLVRDRLGIKPLFWARTAHGLAFASELPALLRHPGVGRDLEVEEIPRWLQLGYGGGPRTLARGVNRLLPGHRLTADAGGVRIERWYDVLAAMEERAVESRSLGEAAEEFEGLLRQSVRRRLVSDVPLGCFLSGGVDSAAVVGAAVAEGAAPEVLTVRFAGGEDESEGAARVAESLGLEHRVVECAPADLEESLAGWARVSGDPLADPSLLPTGMVAVEARRLWTVALSGDGGDELFSGYPRLRAMPRLTGVFRLPRALRRMPGLFLPPRRWAAKLQAALAAADPRAAYQALQGVWPAAEVAALLGRREVDLPWTELDAERLDRLPAWTRWRALDVQTFLPERMLAKVDRASMAASLEVRVPLLDHRVVEFALSLPPTMAKDKRILRRTLDRFGMPQPARRKVGFEIPLGSWLRGPLRRAVGDLIFDRSADRPDLDEPALRRVWDAHQEGRADFGERLLAVAVLHSWIRDILQ